MTKGLLILALASALCRNHICSLDYSEIQGLGVACPLRDTCTANITRSIYTTSCECDVKCSYYGDCCIDADVPRNGHRSEVSLEGLHMTCMYLPREEGVYAVSKCKSSWRGGEDIRGRCENLDSFDDPLLAIPATDQSLNVTYRNRYCALCNDARYDLASWAVSINYFSLIGVNATFRNITEEYILNNLLHQDKSWGLNHWNPTAGRIEFYPIDVMYHKPVYLSGNVRYCRENVVSTCDPNYRRTAIREKCYSYMAVVYFSGTAYRNGHCALCNNMRLKNRVCELSIVSRQPPTMSFSLLLDVNTSDGNLVGVTRRCGSDEKYDPFFKKCRVLSCALPGFVLKNGKCERKR